MNESLKSAIEMLREIYAGAQITASRNRLDVLSDRIRQAGTEPTLLAFAERLQALLDTSPSSIHSHVLVEFITSASRSEAPAVLAWIRQYHRIAAMLAGLRDQSARDEALATIEVDAVAITEQGQALPRRPFDIRIEAVCLTPLAHGGDTKAGNATLFRRMNVLSTTGQVLSLPFYAGNAIRGQLRDLLADHLLSALGLLPRRDSPPCSLWFFHTLYAGGALEENSAAIKALGARFGKAAGTLRTEGLREFRDLLPSVSLLGCALGNRVLCGRAQFGDLRPRCQEWGAGEAEAAKLMDWTYLTRREDLESHADGDHSGMIATTETLKAGTVLDGGIDVDQHCQPIERAALGRGLLLLQRHGRIGAENRRDLGGVQIEFENLPDAALYDQFLEARANDVRTYLLDIGAISAPGNSARKSDPA